MNMVVGNGSSFQQGREVSSLHESHHISGVNVGTGAAARGENGKKKGFLF